MRQLGDEGERDALPLGFALELPEVVGQMVSHERELRLEHAAESLEGFGRGDGFGSVAALGDLLQLAKRLAALPRLLEHVALLTEALPRRVQQLPAEGKERGDEVHLCLHLVDQLHGLSVQYEVAGLPRAGLWSGELLLYKTNYPRSLSRLAVLQG